MSFTIALFGLMMGHLGGSTVGGTVSGGGASTAGTPIGLLLALTKAS